VDQPDASGGSWRRPRAGKERVVAASVNDGRVAVGIPKALPNVVADVYVVLHGAREVRVDRSIDVLDDRATGLLDGRESPGIPGSITVSPVMNVDEVGAESPQVGKKGVGPRLRSHLMHGHADVLGWLRTVARDDLL